MVPKRKKFKTIKQKFTEELFYRRGEKEDQSVFQKFIVTIIKSQIWSAMR